MNNPASWRLKNGALVHHYPHISGVIGLGVVVPAGGRNDPKGKEGLAHVTEHMLFAGSERWSADRREAELVKRGAMRNGITTPDTTFYWVALPNNEYAFGFEYLHQLLFRPTFPIEGFEHEMQRITREAGREELAWTRQLEDKFLDWGITPLDSIEQLKSYLLRRSGNSESFTIGFADTRRRIQIEDVKNFIANIIDQKILFG